MQKDERRAELESAGFTDLIDETIEWVIEMNAAQTRGLISTFSPVLKLHESERVKFLDNIEKIVIDDFGGKVTRNFKSVIYLCRKPLK